MKYINRASNYGHNLHTVELTPEEWEYSNEKLMHMVDNGYAIQDWWPEVEAGKRHPGHFGGTVHRHLDNTTVTIKIYID